MPFKAVLGNDLKSDLRGEGEPPKATDCEYNNKNTFAYVHVKIKSEGILRLQS